MSSFFRNLALLGFVFFGSIALAQNRDGLIVNADRMSTDFNSKITSLKGRVQIAFRGQYLSCDSATINYKTKQIEAVGHVKLQSATVYSEASRLLLNYEDDTATMNDGYIQSGQVVFEGKFIQKTGPNTFLATDAHYTACASCPPTWSFTGKELQAELGGYAKIKRPVLRFGGVPVFILPGILVPLKSARQSGFLVPSQGYSSDGGLAVGQSFFWAIDRSTDATLTAKYYELRGFKGLAEYRYVLSDNSRGEIDGAFIRDRALKRKDPFRRELDRWFVNYEHYYDLPGHYVQRAQIKELSDRRYLRDFPDEVEGLGGAAIDNRASLSKNTHRQHYSAEIAYHVNLLKTDPLSSNEDAVHRFPQLQYSLTDTPVGTSPVLFRLDTEFTNFSRTQFSYDDIRIDPTCPGGTNRCATVGSSDEVVRDGNFDGERDIIRTGQRLILRPTLSLPFKIGDAIEVTPQVAFNEMQYRFGLDPALASAPGPTPNPNFSKTAAQRYVDAEISLRTSWSRVFGDISKPQAVRYKHEIEPNLTFSTIPWIRRPDHSFFGDFDGQRYALSFEPITDADVFGANRLQYDYKDRVFDREIVELSLTNRLTRKRWSGQIPDYRRIVTFRLSQYYDFQAARTRNKQPWSPINGLLDMRFDHFQTYTTASYNPYAKVANSSIWTQFNTTMGSYLQLKYTRFYSVDAENKVQQRNQTENLGAGLGFKTRYMDFLGQVDYSAITYKIQSWNYIARFKPPGNCWVISFDHKQPVGGRPEFDFTMNFQFGGEEKSH